MKREKTKYSGVYQRISSSKIYQRKPDICFDIVYTLGGKKIFEKIGWLSEGYSAKLASDVRGERIRAKRHGEEIPTKKKAILFKDLAEKYLKWSAESKTRSGGDDKSRYNKHIKPRFEHKGLNEISPLDLEKMKVGMRKTGLSPKTISHCLGLIRAMYNKAGNWGMYQGSNPVKNVKMPVIQNARDRFLSIEEAKTLLKELKRNTRFKNEYKELEDSHLHDIALISLHTGARASEIFNLKGQDIDLTNGLITLRDTKNTTTRYSPITELVKELLKRRMPKDKNCYVFTDRNGEKIKSVSNAFEKAVDRLKFNEGITDPRQKVVFHSLRHTFASWLAIQGTPIYTIARLMGHKSISMSERYSHLSPGHKKEAINGLETAFNGNKENKLKIMK